MKPLVSIIIPNYNHSRYLVRRFESILTQTYKSIEIIVLDDASTDNSVDVINEYVSNPAVSHIIINESNSGSPFAQWEKGIKLAKGEYIWIAESDDWAEPNFLEKLVAEIEKDENTVLAYSSVRFVSHDGVELFETKFSRTVKKYDSKRFINEKLVVDCLINNVSSVIFKKSACSFDLGEISKFKLCGDWMFYVLICQRGNVIHVDSCLSNFRRHTESTAYKLERKGLGIIEGIEIYRYLKKIRILIGSPIHFNTLLAKKWLSNEIYYNYSAEINRQIRKKLFPENSMLIIFQAIGKVRKMIKGVNYKAF